MTRLKINMAGGRVSHCGIHSLSAGYWMSSATLGSIGTLYYEAKLRQAAVIAAVLRN